MEKISKIIILVLTLIYPLFMVILSGAGLIYNQDKYGSDISFLGLLWIISGLIITIATVLCLLNRNVIAIIFSLIGFILCMTVLYIISNHADSCGWVEPYTLQPVSDMYKFRIIPTALPCIGIVIVSGLKIWEK